MTTTNDITGDKIATKTVTETYRNNYAGIDWSKKAGSIAVASTTPPHVKPKCERHAWAATAGLPPGPATCIFCGVRQKDLPAAELLKELCL